MVLGFPPLSLVLSIFIRDSFMGSNKEKTDVASSYHIILLMMMGMGMGMGAFCYKTFNLSLIIMCIQCMYVCTYVVLCCGFPYRSVCHPCGMWQCRMSGSRKRRTHFTHNHEVKSG
jgi:hypothetical protein